MASPFKDLQEAVYDIKKTVEMDGEQFIPDNHTIWLTQSQWDAVIVDPYLLTLPTAAIDDLVANKILGVNVRVRP
jgi:hypothetical protein